jgi:hypothetical protein
MANRSELAVDKCQGLRRDGKADSLIASRFGSDHRIHADDLSMNVNQGSTGIARVDRRIRLKVDDWAADIELALGRAYDAKSERVLQSKGTAKRHRKLSDPNEIRVRQLQSPKPLRVDLDECDVGECV